MVDERKPTVNELWAAARQGMVWTNTPIEDKIDKLSVLRLWIKEEDITEGVFAVKGTALYDNCMKWCKERKVSKVKISIHDFASFLKDNFRKVNYQNRQHYFINKELKENEEAKKERQKKHNSSKTREARKTKSKKTLGSRKTDL